MGGFIDEESSHWYRRNYPFPVESLIIPSARRTGLAFDHHVLVTWRNFHGAVLRWLFSPSIVTDLLGPHRCGHEACEVTQC